jgi:poly(3-hydroxybutyrate) depolymerase
MFKSLGKSLSVLFAAAAIVAGATALSGANEPASATAKLGKADRLDIRATGPKCSEQAWPYYEAGCVKGSAKADPTRTVRIVTSDKISATTVSR